MNAPPPDPEPTLVIVGKKRGRPIAAVRTAQVTTCLPTPLVDRLCQLAHARGMSLSAVTRQIVILGLKRL